MKNFLLGILITVGLISSTAGIYIAYSSFQEHHALWESENKCIATEVAKGTERINIERDNGGCYVK